MVPFLMVRAHFTNAVHRKGKDSIQCFEEGEIAEFIATAIEEIAEDSIICFQMLMTMLRRKFFPRKGKGKGALSNLLV